MGAAILGNKLFWKANHILKMVVHEYKVQLVQQIKSMIIRNVWTLQHILGHTDEDYIQSHSVYTQGHFAYFCCSEPPQLQNLGFGTPMSHHCVIADLHDKVTDPFFFFLQRTQQHGKLCYLKVTTSAVSSFSIMVCNVLHVPLPCQWIGRGGPIPCLPKVLT